MRKNKKEIPSFSKRILRLKVNGELKEVGPGHIVEVVFTYKYSDALIVDIEEGLEVAKFVRFMNLFHRAEWEPESIARRELEHESGLQRTLNVDMQFCFWNLLNKRLHQAPLDDCNKGIRLNPKP